MSIVGMDTRRIRDFVKKAFSACYTCCYVTGLQTVRFVRFSLRRGAACAAPAGRFLRTWLSSRRRWTLRDTLNLAAPAAAVLLLVATVNYWGGVTFGLALEYQGQQLGFISNEAVYERAADLATQRVNNTDNSFHVERTPKLTVAVVQKRDILNETALCDEILRSSGNEIAEAAGLYVNGQFEGSLQSAEELQGILDGLIAPYLTPDGTAEFVKKVEIVEGLYPLSSMIATADMQQQLTTSSMVEKRYVAEAGDSLQSIARKQDMSLAQLRALNPTTARSDMIHIGQEFVVRRAQPYLGVHVKKTMTYTQEMPYTVKRIDDPSRYVGVQAVKTKGKAGTQSVTAEVIFLDGAEQSRKILSTAVIQAPVEEVVVNGTKKMPALSNGTKIKGLFLWPVPSCHNIYSNYGPRDGTFHPAIDISGSGINGKPIVAARAGTVIEANSTNRWGAGYGYYLLIDHGDGFVTRYAHASKLFVQRGDKVTAGQQIANVGNTGYSTGPHLHFEIILHGKTQNPNNYY